jgi:UDP-galactopyranose mutase
LYRRDADQIMNKVLFAGRLADYKYYNMDQAVARALKMFEDEVVPR